MDRYPRKKKIIFDTDMGPDYDDVGAIAILHALADTRNAKFWQPFPATDIQMLHLSSKLSTGILTEATSQLAYPKIRLLILFLPIIGMIR